MFELTESDPTKIDMIDFGRKGKVLFKLPVLGAAGVPSGVMSAFSMFYSLFEQGRDLTDREVASAWSYFVQVLVDSYPDAARHLAQLDTDQFKSVMDHWVEASKEAGYDPKA